MGTSAELTPRTALLSAKTSELVEGYRGRVLASEGRALSFPQAVDELLVFALGHTNLQSAIAEDLAEGEDS